MRSPGLSTPSAAALALCTSTARSSMLSPSGAGPRARSCASASAPACTGKLKKAAFAEGLICYPMPGTRDGKTGDHVLLAPPFIATEAELDGALDALSRALDGVLAAA